MPRLTTATLRERLAAHSPGTIPEHDAPQRAAVSILLREVPGEVPFEILFIRRTRRDDDPWSGHVAFPGGRRDERDRTLLETARRESLEEVGIDPGEACELLGRLDDLRASSRGRILPMAISPFVFLLEQVVSPAVSDEVDEVLWAPLTVFFDPSATTTVRYEVDGRHRVFPGVTVGGAVVWGLTYLMIGRLLEVLGLRAGPTDLVP